MQLRLIINGFKVNNQLNSPQFALRDAVGNVRRQQGSSTGRRGAARQVRLRQP